MKCNIVVRQHHPFGGIVCTGIINHMQENIEALIPSTMLSTQAPIWTSISLHVSLFTS